MRVRWWQSIRWRLALGSMLVAFLATALLALTVIIAINYYYGADERQRLTNVANDTSHGIGESYAESGSLGLALRNTLPQVFANTSQSGNYVFVVLDRSRRLVYPTFKSQPSIFARLLGVAVDPTLQKGDYTKITQAVTSGEQGHGTDGEIGQSNPGNAPRFFAVRPIFAGRQGGMRVIGVLIVIPRSVAEDTIPPFIATVRQSVLIASMVVAVLAALAAIFFSRTITRPLAKLTGTAHVLASGDYSARVKTNARSELGELANTFNEMATRLERDVDELRKQELWRRELIMNITHDLATPLTAIAGLGEALVDGVNQSREDYEATGRIIVRETLRLRRMVKDLHMMAKVEAGAMQIQCKALRLAALVDEVLAVLAPEFERADVEPRNSIAYDLPPVWADHDMLMRVFSNLCDNALRYTPPGGTVIIDAKPQGNMLEVSVTDSGEGIPAEALPRVFDRFYRIDASRQIATGGSGLGLAIVRAIVEAHGGRVWAVNTSQGGAQIVFTLPLVSSEQITSVTTLPLR